MFFGEITHPTCYDFKDPLVSAEVYGLKTKVKYLSPGRYSVEMKSFLTKKYGMKAAVDVRDAMLQQMRTKMTHVELDYKPLSSPELYGYLT